MSAEPSALPASPAPLSQSSDLNRTAVAILAAMVLLIVALTGILVETTWNQPAGEVEVLRGDPGSFARR